MEEKNKKMDYKTLNEVYEKCSPLRPGFMMYGEGWSMPTLMDKKLMGTQLNNKLMPNIGFFNDRFREQIKGDTFEPTIGGYTTGNKYDIEIVEDVILGSSKKVKYGVSYLSPNNVVNYVECHDNATLWDKIGFVNPDESDEINSNFSISSILNWSLVVVLYIFFSGIGGHTSS